MEKVFKILVLLIFFIGSGCSKELTTSDLKLQGEWVLAKDPIISEVVVVYLKINFDKNKFGLQRIYGTDVSGRGDGEFYIEGDFKSDENFIYLKGTYVKENYYYGDYDKVKKKYEGLQREFNMNLRYKFSNDSLMLKEIYSEKEFEIIDDDFKNGIVQFLIKDKTHNDF